MRNTLLDFSQRAELERHARIIADVQAVTNALAVRMIITGAFARDLHVFYAYGIDTVRQTEDVDFGLAVGSWDSFAEVKARLLQSGRFSALTNVQQRLRHVSDVPVDLVPFAGVEAESRHITWPPGGEFRMDVFGFREALAAARIVRLPRDVEVPVVSLPALALLKIIAWQDRHYQAPGKDAHDLMLIAANYLDLGNQERLWDEFLDWTRDESFDTRHAGARMLGIDIGKLLNRTGRERVLRIMNDQADMDRPALLPQQMDHHDPDRARALLQGMIEGLIDSTQSR
jgi:predicted nucleotidyltransferase